MKIVVTGASGFIGQHVVKKLLGAGHTVFAIVRPGSEGKLAPRPGLSVLAAELNGLTEESLAGAGALIHLAATGVLSDGDDWGRCFATNVTESLRTWQAAVRAGVPRLVICGSCFEYGNSALRYDFIPVAAPLEPTGAYHSSKAAATMAALGLAVAFKLEVVVLRPFHVFGEGEAESRFWPSLRRAALAGADFPMSGGEQVRDFVPVDTVAATFVQALSKQLTPGVPKIANVGTGIPLSLAQFARHWWMHWGAAGTLKLGAVPYRPNEVMRYVPDLSPS